MATLAPIGGESRGVSMYALLDSPVRREIVDLLANPPAAELEEGAWLGLTTAELAQELGLHVTTIRFHLDRLVTGGLVESEFRTGRVGRPRKVYRFRPRDLGIGSTARADQAHRALAELLTEAWSAGRLGEPLSPEEAGERWVRHHADVGHSAEPPARTPGAWIGKVGRTVDLLSRWGYRPDLRTTEDGRSAEFTLVDCPFLALAETNTDVVCGVHRGLLKGAMDAVGEPDTEVSLHPFVGPGRCLATVTRTHLPDPDDPGTKPDEETAP